MDIDLNQVRETLVKKDSARLLAIFFKLMSESWAKSTAYIDTGSLDEDFKQFESLVGHAENLWDDAVRLLKAGSFATSRFVSIAAIEEIGKISVIRFQIIFNNREDDVQVASNASSRKNPMFSHNKKHQLAAFAGLAINSHADRILGVSNILTLFELAHSNRIEHIRQNSIYSKSMNGNLALPTTCCTENEARFFCTVAGELLAEIGGFNPVTFSRLIDKVEVFEGQFPLPANYSLQQISAT